MQRLVCVQHHVLTIRRRCFASASAVDPRRASRFFSLALALAMLASCGGESADAPAPADATGCAPPNRLVGDACREPGVQDDGCPAGSVGLGDGACRAAGIAPEMCGEGFEHDGDVGCEPILPPRECPAGQMAVPGEATCRPVMPCASGKWGAIATDAMTQHVDGSYAGGGSDGSAAKPWTTIGDAIDAAEWGATVAVAAGSYAEDVSIGKPIALAGVCPDEVEIVGTGTEVWAVLVRDHADGAAVRGVAITGDSSMALLVTGSQQVLVEEVRVHDSAGRGITVQDTLGPTSCTVRGSLVEETRGVGMFVAGAEVVVDATVIRGTVASALGVGRGVGIQPNTETGGSSVVTVSGSVVERNQDRGVFAAGSMVTVQASVVRGTLPDAQGLGGRGIGCQAFPDTNAPCIATVRTSVVEQNSEVGIDIQGSEATIEATVVRGTQLNSEGLLGRGIGVQVGEGGVPSAVTVRSSLVDQNHDVAVNVSASNATVEASVLRGTMTDGQGLLGRGISIQSAAGAPATAFVRGSLVDQNHDVGVFVGGSQATVEGTVVRGTLPIDGGLFGRGLLVQLDPGTGATSTATVRSSLFEQNHDVSVIVATSELAIESTVVRATLPRADGLFGDGVSASSEQGPATLSVISSRVEESARAGVSSFGSFVSIGATAVQCAAFDLEGESYGGTNFTFDDRGGNLCGCPSADGACVSVSVGLEPPAPVGAIE